MDMGVNEKSNAGFSWVVYDLSHSYIHFFLPSERARINIDSFYLGQVQCVPRPPLFYLT